MGRMRRKASVTNQEDNASSCSTPPSSKDKKNRFPTFVDEDKQQKIVLRKDFDKNVEMTIKDMLANKQVLIEKLTIPFITAILKMPLNIKKMKWGGYLKLRKNQSQETSNTLPDKAIETNHDAHNFALSTGSSKMETPAIRSSSRLANNKIPIFTPKFDPATGDIINTRLQIPGETLYSEKGSPVVPSNPLKLSAREFANLTTDKELVVAFLNNPETFNTFKAFEKKHTTITGRAKNK
ncbi:hypothetical protein DAPPUDRAFT_307600 [Daphnia pulex]|uniref:Uncharacterized protein n=1 Tax=Daphnia pulex TaxID=6669 RepID=E9H3B7_DAPPU|nr:hypothetical protein DAPPUDRAFT_307600 [Daphnia pulex]|eukprot:EFX73732.1 hypothetical protein DAPPUDRAFT_307600 [Daphnia pulex]